jgi:O-antigen/teichoic acid export membrane protein
VTLRRNAIANVAGRAATAILWVVVTPFTLAHLGAERFGIWALFFAFGGYLATFNLGLGNTMIRFIAADRAAGDRAALRQTLRRGLGLGLGLGVLWAGLVLGCRGWIVSAFRVPAEVVPETLGALMLFAIGVLLTFPVQVLTGALQGFERVDLSNLAVLFGVGAHVGAIYLTLLAGGGLTEVAAAGVIGQAVTGLLAGALLWKPIVRVPARAAGARPTWRDLLSFGVALQLVNLLSILQLQVGKIVLGLVGTLAMVADFELAFRVASGVAGIPFLFLAAVIPTITRVWESEGPLAVTAMYTAQLRWIYAQTVIVLGALWLLAPDITRIWLGAEHDRIAPLIRLWALAFAVNLSWIPAATIVRSVGWPWMEVWSLLACVLANVGLGLWLASRYGATGAAAALAVSFLAGFFVFEMQFRRSGKSLGPWIGRELAPRVLAGCLAVAACGLLVSAPGVSSLLPPPGWSHAAITTTLFLVIFGLLFLYVGDTQRISRMAWQLTLGAWARRRDVAPS